MRREKKSWQRRLLTYPVTIAGRSFKFNIRQSFPLWIASFFVALLAVLYTFLFGYAEELMNQVISYNRALIFLLAPVCFVLAWLPVHFFAPNARGSGIPQVMAAIDLAPSNPTAVSSLLSIRILLVKIFSSLTMVLGGGAIGREGPTIQIAASVFNLINRVLPKSWPKLTKQNYLLTGAAAGLAAAFNTPLGGIVFAIEELATVHIRLFRTALLAAVIIAGLTAQYIIGPYLYLGYPHVKGLDSISYLGAAVTSAIAGLAGAMLAKIILALIRWKQGFTLLQHISYVVVAGLITAALAYTVDTAILGSGKTLMNQVLFTSNKSVDEITAASRILGPVISFNTGAAGGIFAPSLSAGASIGAYIAGLLEITAANSNILILSGMVAFLTAVTRTPFTSAILVLEMTDRHSVIFHLMLAAMVANIVAHLVDKKSFYEHLKEMFVVQAKEKYRSDQE